VSVDIFFNDAPVAEDQELVTDEDTPINIILTANDDYPGSLTWDYAQPNNGTLSGTAPDLTYTPDENWNGEDSFTFDVDDGIGGLDSGTVSITVNPVDDPPVALNQTISTFVDTPVEFTLEVENVDQDDLIWYREDQTAHGFVEGYSPNLEYMPSPGYKGVDYFSFFVYDGISYSNDGVITINIYEKPVINAEDLNNAMFMANNNKEFSVTLTNSADGASYSNVIVRFRVVNVTSQDIQSLEYLDTSGGSDIWTPISINEDQGDLVGTFGPGTGFPMSAPYSETTDFRASFNTDGPYEILIELYDISEGTEKLLASTTASIEVVEEFEVNNISLIRCSTFQEDQWKTVRGSLSDGYALYLNPDVDFYYLDGDVITANRPIKDGSYPFYLDTSQLPPGFYDYWNNKGVYENVSGTWEPVMWKIISGNQPMFYLEVSGSEILIKDGLRVALKDEETDYLRINGDYLPGKYHFVGSVQDDNGFVEEINASMTLLNHCLSIAPQILEFLLDEDMTDTKVFNISNSCDYDVEFELVEYETLLREDFEDNSMPPAGGWETKHEGTTNWQWSIANWDSYVFQGDHSAFIRFDNDNESNEWLISPVIDITGFTEIFLTFRGITDTKYPGATMKVWLLNESGEKLTDEPLWDLIRDEDWENTVYRGLIVDLSSHAGAGNVRLGWQYIGQEGQSFGMDMVEVLGLNDIPWLDLDQSTGVIQSGSSTEISINFSSIGMEKGEYYSSIFLWDTFLPVDSSQISMNVKGDDFEVYLPLIVH